MPLDPPVITMTLPCGRFSFIMVGPYVNRIQFSGMDFLGQSILPVCSIFFIPFRNGIYQSLQFGMGMQSRYAYPDTHVIVIYSRETDRHDVIIQAVQVMAQVDYVFQYA